ncbi:MAG: trypsin-like peptidase domain-containing protein [Planctomycetales bacterium]|nr:trypsin-like peptidase domain-containing protein [Planctomycetales bacterium]
MRQVAEQRRHFTLLLAVMFMTAGGFAHAQSLQQFQSALETAIARAEPSVVAIARVRQGSAVAPADPAFVPSEYATGVVVGKGQILTSYHVLGNPEHYDYWVWHGGAPYQVVKVERPRAADPWLDLALLEIEAETQPITLGDANTLKKGHIVVALGNPYAIARDGEVSASLGIVSNLKRKAPPLPGQETRETLHQLGTLLQVDARLPRGCSGGALINTRGELVGLTLSLAALADEDTEAGFAIPVDETFRRALKKLQLGQVDNYGYLGVLPASLPLRERQEGKRGVLVQNVMPGTPAAAAGLRRMDLIVEVAGQPVANPHQLVRIIGALPAGRETELVVERGEQRRSTLRRTVLLSKKRVAGDLPVIAEEEPQPWRGATVEYLTAMPEYPFHSYKIDPLGSVGLVAVEEGSPMHRAGFRSGDYVSHVNGKRVSTPAEFLALADKQAGVVELRRPASQGAQAEDVQVSP